MMETCENTRKYIPTLPEWAELYVRWADRLVQSLWKSGSESARQEAVHTAFLKVAGLSDRLSLSKPLEPKTDGEWYVFLRWQAKSVLSHNREYASRFEPIRDYAAYDYDDEPSYEADFEAFEREEFCREVRKAIRKVCAKAGVSTRNCKAFERFVLDEKDGDAVVAEFPTIRNTNNLYQIKKRIIDVLKRAAHSEQNPFSGLMAA